VEAQGRALPAPAGAIFRSPELRRYELARVPKGVQPLPVPAEVRRVTGWTETTRLPGALPAAR
jgi:hypothetical protein